MSRTTTGGILAALSLVLGWMLASGASAQSGPTTEQKTVSTYKENVVVERTTTVQEVVTTTRTLKEKYKCAIFVTNRAEKVSDAKVEEMQDLLTGYATDKGFIMLSREDVINSVGNLSDAGPNRGDVKLVGANLDKMLSNNTSALRLANNLEADYVLVVSITSFGTDTQRFKDTASGIDLLNKKHQLRATWKLLDGTMGGSMTAGVATAVINDRTAPGSSVVERENVVDDLIDSAAMDMAGMLDRASRRGVIDSAAVVGGNGNAEVTFAINCNLANMAFPEVIKTAAGSYEITPNQYHLEAAKVVVELDGVVIGSTGGAQLKARPGLHKLRLRRAMLEDYEGTVKISQGMCLQIDMQFTPEGFADFKTMSASIERLKQSRALTDADVKVLEGYARKLSQSGIKVDINGDNASSVRETKLLATDVYGPLMNADLKVEIDSKTKP
jgi:hypothetical protein